MSKTVTTLPDDTNVQNKVADMGVADDGSGTNDLRLSGDDAAPFEIIDTEIYLNAGRDGSVIHIRAIAADGRSYGVKAISPQRHLYDLKDIKMRKDPVNMKVSGVPVAAHIKALPLAPAL